MEEEEIVEVVTVARPPRIEKHITEMTDEEREALFCPKSRESYERCKREGLYHCKRDRCKEACQKKEQEEKNKAEQQQDRVKVLEERELVWVKHAREQETTQKKMQKDIEKMAGLLAQLLPK